MTAMPEIIRTTRSWGREDVANAASHLKIGTAIARGLANRCPNCGKGHIFDGYLTVVRCCEHCAIPLGRLRADDAPPYITLLIVCHIVVALLVAVETGFSPPTWLEVAIFLPLTALLVLGLLRPIKGATVGVMLAVGLMPKDDA